MIVVMKRDATPEQVEYMVQRVTSLGLKPHVLHGVERTVVAAIGAERDGLKESLESGPGVADVLPILAPYKIASREVKSEPTVVQGRQPAGGRIARGRDRRPLLGRKRGANPQHRGGVQGGRRRRRCAAARSSPAPARTASRDSRKRA